MNRVRRLSNERAIAACLVLLSSACSYDWTVHSKHDGGVDGELDGGVDSDVDGGVYSDVDGGVDAEVASDSAESFDSREGGAFADDAEAVGRDARDDASTPVDGALPLESSCRAGYVDAGGSCTDIDECSEGLAACHPSAKCANTDGAYDCVCKTGFAGGGPTGIACAPRVSVGGVFSDSSRAHFCATRPNGQVACWGNNASGQLGDGTSTDRLTPTVVSGVTDAAFVVAGIDTSCAVIKDGSVRCWGAAAGKQWGEGSLTPVTLGGLKDIVQLSLSQTGCAVDQSGSVFCWGENGDGQVGTGQTSGIPIVHPTKVGALGPAAWATTSAVATVSCAALRTGASYCWGKGQLTSADTVSSAVPVAIPSIDDAVEVVPMYSRTCARRYNGQVTCWGAPQWVGSSSSGQALLDVNVTSIAGGIYDTCLVKSSGLLCAGLGGSAPGPAPDAEDVLVVAHNAPRAYGLTASGRLKVWNTASAVPPPRSASEDVTVW